jgi:hypothetical protein
MGIKRDVLILLGMLALVAVILGAIVGLALFAVKAVGILLILAGIFLVVFFPGVGEYQKEAMVSLGVKMGFVLIIAGLALLFLL